KQEAVRSDTNQIPVESLKKWKLDVVANTDQTAVVDMLLKHFSLWGDQVLLVNAAGFGEDYLGRKLVYETFTVSADAPPRYSDFVQSSFFSRFAVLRDPIIDPDIRKIDTDFDNIEVIQGDCFEVLSKMPGDSIDGAVTSPPYYNARSYSQWPNIY